MSISKTMPKIYNKWFEEAIYIMSQRLHSISLAYNNKIHIIPVNVLRNKLCEIMDRLKPCDIRIIFPKGGNYELLLKQFIQMMYEYTKITDHPEKVDS